MTAGAILPALVWGEANLGVAVLAPASESLLAVTERAAA